jgi:hypothetical protein
MSIDQFIAVAASIGSCMAAIATFLTVRQMSKQRTDSYHPELALSRIVFDARPLTDGGLPTLWRTTSNSDSENIDGTKSPFSFSVPLSNIGLGAAKDVKIFWEFPLGELTEKINQLAQSAAVAARFTFDNGMLSTESELFGKQVSIWKNQQKAHIDYVLPAAVQHEPETLQLPHAYVVAASAFFHMCAKNKNRQSFPELPALKVTFNYLDIGDRKHTAAFDMELEVGAFAVGFMQASVVPKKRIA